MRARPRTIDTLDKLIAAAMAHVSELRAERMAREDMDWRDEGIVSDFDAGITAAKVLAARHRLPISIVCNVLQRKSRSVRAQRRTVRERLHQVAERHGATHDAG